MSCRIGSSLGARDSIFGLGLALGLGGLLFVLNLSIVGPEIQGDEGSYLANASAIAGYPNDLGGSYRSGYSFLIAPAFWMGESPPSVWTFVKAINALILAATVFVFWQLSRELGQETRPLDRLAAVLVVSSYPMWVALSGFAFSNIAFVLFFSISVLFLLRAVRGGLASSVGLGLAVGYLYWIHPIGLIPSIVACALLGYHFFARRFFGEFLCLCLTTAAVILLYALVIEPWLHARMTTSGQPPDLFYPGLGRLLAPLATQEGWVDIIIRGSGHVLYLLVGTFGLVSASLFGLYRAAYSAASESGGYDAELQRILFVYLVACLLLVLGSSVMLIVSKGYLGRLDHWFYGRHTESVLAPILLIGLLQTSLRDVLWSIPIAILTVIVIWLGMESYSGKAVFNIAALWQQFYFDHFNVFLWFVPVLLLIAFIAIAPKRLGMLIIFAIFLVVDFKHADRRSITSENVVKHRWRSAMFVRNEFPPGTCVGFDHDTIKDYFDKLYWWDFGFVLYDYDLRRMRYDEWLKNCDGPLLAFPTPFDSDRAPNYIAAADSRGNGPLVWVKAEPSTDTSHMEFYPIRLNPPNFPVEDLLGPGWYGPETTHVWSSGSAILKLPIPKVCRSTPCGAKLEFWVHGASSDRPVAVTFSTVDAEPWHETLIIDDRRRHDVLVPLQVAGGFQVLQVSVPDAAAPRDLGTGSDARTLGIAFSTISLLVED